MLKRSVSAAADFFLFEHAFLVCFALATRAIALVFSSLSRFSPCVYLFDLVCSSF